MLDRAELDVRFASHAVQVDRIGSLAMQSTPRHRHAAVRQSAATVLLHLANWLAPNQIRDSAAA